MGISSLGNVLKLFSSSELSDVDKHALFAEAVLMTLARATSADTNIQPVEVETVQDVVQVVTGAEVSEAEVRVAAKSELFAKNPLDKCLKKVAAKLDVHHRVRIVHALAEVIKSDVRISPRETEFFDRVAGALGIRPSELAGLFADD